MHGSLHGTMIDRHCMRCLVNSEAFGIMNCGVIQNMTGSLSACEEYEMTIERASVIKAAIYGQVKRE